MQYLSKNFSSKAAARRAIASGETVRIRIVEGQTQGRPKNSRKHGQVVEHTVAGPWFPQPHSWYGNALVDDSGVVLEVK